MHIQDRVQVKLLHFMKIYVLSIVVLVVLVIMRC